MKIRTGFVSNSSSSSFLVAFPRNPKSVDDIINMVFGDEIKFYNPYDFDNTPDSWPVAEVAEIIWNNVKKQIPNNKNRITCNMNSLAEYDDFIITTSDKNSGVYDFDDDAYIENNNNILNSFMDKNNGDFFYYFEYSDNNKDIESAMKHGDLFQRLPHLISNNH